MTIEHFDVLVVGAGLSGIAAAYHLQTRCPQLRYAILEARDAIGGTWDLFRYPGVRSDSDMHTLGYSFRPWRSPKAIADGPAILAYIRDTAREFGIEERIRFRHRVRRLSWSSGEARWRVEVERGPSGEIAELTCSFLFMGSGYYRYEGGHAPEWPGMELFGGHIVHPQHWPEDLDYAGKRVVVIGSGATAVTLVPALARSATHVTMLQRSPTYIVTAPSEDATANWLHRRLPEKLAHRLARWRSIALGIYFYQYARRNPLATREAILQGARDALGRDYPIETHFAPRYNPWDQRLCVVPDGDLFAAIKAGRASIATDTIATFTETGLRLRSGQELDADIIVTATGLAVQLMGGAQLTVDGAPVNLGQTLSYKGLMYGGVPNLASAFGYTNSSWTLKCELVAQYVCRLLNYMRRHGYAVCVPTEPATRSASDPALPLSSGYVQRASGLLPRQGGRRPWRVYQNYIQDLLLLRLGRVNDGAMRFARRGERVRQPAREGAVG